MDRSSAELDVTDEDRAAASRYAAVIEWADVDGIYVATVPDIPNLHTHGATREAAATAADEVTALWIAGARETEIPVPPRFSALPADFDAARVAALRKRLNLTQHEFAQLLNVSVSAVRGWEQGLRTPDGASQRLLGIAEREPEVLAAGCRSRVARRLGAGLAPATRIRAEAALWSRAITSPSIPV